MFVAPLNLSKIAPFALAPSMATITIEFDGDIERMLRRQRVFSSLEIEGNAVTFGVGSLSSATKISDLFRYHGELRKIMEVCGVTIINEIVTTQQNESLNLSQVQALFKGCHYPESTDKHKAMFGTTQRRGPVGALAVVRSASW